MCGVCVCDSNKNVLFPRMKLSKNNTTSYKIRNQSLMRLDLSLKGENYSQ